jgi:hypothetical protein
MTNQRFLTPDENALTVPVEAIVRRLRVSGDTEAADALVYLQDMLFDVTSQEDSYGVPGSSWDVCTLCDAEGKPGLLANGIPHEKTCPCFGSSSQQIKSA